MADKVVKVAPDLAKKVVHGEVSLPAAVKQIEHKPEKPEAKVEPPAPTSEPTADDDRLAEARDTIVALSAENEELRAKLAVEQMDASEEGKLDAAELIDDLRAKVRTLTAERDAMRVSRDNFQAENAKLKKQLAMQQRELKKAGAPA